VENSRWTRLGTSRKTGCASKQLQPYVDNDIRTSSCEYRAEKSTALEMLKGSYCSTAFTLPAPDSIHCIFSATSSSASLASPATMRAVSCNVKLCDNNHPDDCSKL
jgi:hypothetical protein